MPSRPETDIVGLDEERKKELVMEKRLGACRVNIIPRVSRSFSDIIFYVLKQVFEGKGLLCRDGYSASSQQKTKNSPSFTSICSKGKESCCPKILESVHG
jgi:hypothetical protein